MILCFVGFCKGKMELLCYRRSGQLMIHVTAPAAIMHILTEASESSLRIYHLPAPTGSHRRYLIGSHCWKKDYLI